MAHNTTGHDCRAHLNSYCRCTVCGKVRHAIVDNSNGSGTGEVVEWCTRCHRYERYYDDTGTIIESTFRPLLESNRVALGLKCNGELRYVTDLVIQNHNCKDHLDRNQAWNKAPSAQIN
jgi:hypothetical protein